MDLLVSASFIAAFFAGIAALFAPCCITVLLPTYLGSVFKQKSTVFLMTFIYFLGLLTIFLPIGLGVSIFSVVFRDYHNTIFLLGGIFLTLLGIFLVLGKQFSLPFSLHPTLAKYDMGSVYILGVFSAVATTCCAPVLAGVIALSGMAGSFLLGGLYSLAYVLGMVTPLFIIAVFLDKVDFTKKFFVFRKTFTYTIAGREIKVTYANLFSGFVFLSVGLLILFLSQTNQLAMQTSFATDINIFLTKFIRAIGTYTSVLPEPIWAAIFLFLTFLIVNKSVIQIIHLVKQRKDEK